MDTVSIGGIVGSALGILGGIVGTYFSIRLTNSRRERRFAIYTAILVWFILGATRWSCMSSHSCGLGLGFPSSSRSLWELR